MSKAFNIDGEEIEVFTTEELQAEVEKVKGEFTPKLTALESELGLAKKNLGERAGQFENFRKLNEETIAKLSVAERLNYENTLALNNVNEANIKREKETKEAAIGEVIKMKSNGNEKLAGKMKDMWGLLGIEDSTPEQREQKSNMILGAIGTTEPDLLASVGSFSGGAYIPKVETGVQETFADTPRGKQGADELGLILEVKK